MNGCPVLAYEKDKTTGIVKHLDDQCFGCQYCTMMCPYEVPQYSHTLGIVRKCDMCSQRLNVGEAPACVQACPNQAIRITIVDQQAIIDENQNNQTLALVASAPPSRLTLPTTRYITYGAAKSGTQAQSDLDHEFSRYVSSPTLSDKPKHGHWPLALMLVLTQASVGMFCCMAMMVLFSSSFLPSPVDPAPLAFSIVATSVGVVGVHLALLHLGRPMYAFRAFLGWRKSWLSREAILFGVYMGAMTLTSGAWWFTEKLPEYSARLLTFATAFIGVVSVASSAMIYIATQRSLWKMQRTMWDFGVTTLGLGIACSHFFVNGFLHSNLSFALSLMAIGLFFSMASSLYCVFDWKAGGKKKVVWEDFSARSGCLLRGDLRYAYRAMWGGYAIAFAMVIGATSVDGQASRIVVGGLFCLSLIAAKFVGRWLYFASVVTYRMPGAES
jgi:DMSO reductase anchor subunit/ferredoxin